MSTAETLLCEVHATHFQAAALAEIVSVCANDVSLPIKLRVRTHHSSAGEEPLVTLHLPAEIAASQHPAWCLACRLACFCPRARVSVLVKSEGAFGLLTPRRRTRRSA